MIAIGVDPGTACNLALVCSERGWLAYADEHAVAYQATKSKWRPSAVLMANVVKEWVTLENADVLVLEKIGAWSGQGLVSTSEFTRAAGMVEGIAAGVGIECVELTPAKWKRAAGLLKADKDASRGLAARLWPDKAHWLNRKKDHNRAEAALLALAWLGMRAS